MQNKTLIPIESLTLNAVDLQFQTFSALSTSPSEFVNSWRTEGECPTKDLSGKPCDGKEEQMHWARESCRIVREEGVFQRCHGIVDPELFYEMCLQVGNNIMSLSALN